MFQNSSKCRNVEVEVNTKEFLVALITNKRYVPAVASALQPTLGTVRPSAKLGSVGATTGVPALIAVIKLWQRSGSTPCKILRLFLKKLFQKKNKLSKSY